MENKTAAERQRKKQRKPISKGLWSEVLRRQEYRCANRPGSTFEIKEYACLLWQEGRGGTFDGSGHEVDHIQPWCLQDIENGIDPDRIENLQALCANCHKRKTDLERSTYVRSKRQRPRPNLTAQQATLPPRVLTPVAETKTTTIASSSWHDKAVVKQVATLEFADADNLRPVDKTTFDICAQLLKAQHSRSERSDWDVCLMNAYRCADRKQIWIIVNSRWCANKGRLHHKSHAYFVVDYTYRTVRQRCCCVSDTAWSTGMTCKAFNNNPRNKSITDLLSPQLSALF